MYLIQVSMEYASVIHTGQFASKRRAENARRRFEKEMSKGKHRNSDDIVTVRHDTGVITVRASSISTVSITDTVDWDKNLKEEMDRQVALGIRVSRKDATEGGAA